MNETNNNIIRQPVNMAYMLALHTFAYTNTEISMCLSKKHRELLKAPWVVAWFHDNKEFFRPALFTNPVMRHKLELFLMDMSDMILLYGFAGYYYVKDMGKWIMKDPERYLTELPFGVIPMRSAIIGATGGDRGYQNKPLLYGGYFLYTNTQTMSEMIIFECSDKSIQRNYLFGVFNNNAKFVPMYDSLSSLSGSCSSYGDLVPVSQFTSLYRKKSLIEEAIEDEYDCNFSLSHPQTFVTPRYIQDAKVSDIGEAMIYGADTLSHARQSDTASKQLFATQSVKWLVDKLNRQVKGNKKDQEGENSIRNKRKRTHGRPDETEGIHTIAGYVDIQRTHNPSVIVNIDTAQNHFEEEVCNIVGLPFIFFRNDSGVTARSTGTKGGGSGHTTTNEEQLNFYKTVLYDEMNNVFVMLNRLFDDVYTLTYRHIDVYTLARYFEMEEEATALGRKKESREEEEKEERSKKSKSKSKSTNKNEKVKKEKEKEDELEDMMIDLEELAKTRLAGVSVMIKFKKMVARSTASLDQLRECYKDGLVSESYMRNYIELIYGKEEEFIYSQETKIKM